MQPHVRNYLQAFGYSGFEFIPCEVCGAQSIDVHHVEFRSHFGSKRAAERDHIDNLIALCRTCHDAAHDETREWKDKLKEIIRARR